MSAPATVNLSTAELEQILRSVEPSVVLTPSRIMRRVIRMHRGVASFLRQPPHRKTYVIRSEELLSLVDREELDLADKHALPPTVLLIVRPRPEKLLAVPREQLLQDYWRLLFHAKVDAAMALRSSQGLLGSAEAVKRIHAIGQAAFDEIRSVLQKERYLLPPTDNASVYREFVAVYLELRLFLPRALAVYFPSLTDHDRIDRIIAQDIDGGAVFAAARLPGALEPGIAGEVAARLEGEAGTPAPAVAALSAEDQRERKLLHEGLIRRADKASALGNFARAATLRTRAAAQYGVESAEASRSAVRGELQRLAQRLHAIFADTRGDDWTDVLLAILEPSAIGWRTHGARVLYDLQAMCLDHEREIFKLDLVGWMLSAGKVPIRRPLPSKRLVSMYQHLSKAIHRLHAAPFPQPVRTKALAQLEPCLARLDEQVRQTLRPKLAAAIAEVGLVPANPPEEVARHKMVEELLDRVIDRGFIAMGDLRDAISRNQLKMRDVSNWRAFLRDELLHLDRLLARSLDGVYRRGEIYLRLPQRMSSLAFGTNIGRFITRFIAVPYLGAFVLLEAIQHVVHMFTGDPELPAVATELAGDALPAPTMGAATSALYSAAGEAAQAATREAFPPSNIHLNSWPSILIVGSVLLWLLHADRLRQVLFRLIRWAFRKFYGIVVELPSEVLRLGIVQKIVNNRPTRLFYRFVLKPAFFGFVVWFAMRSGGLDFGVSLRVALLFFVLVNLVLNTRAGRSMEEQGGDLILRIWRKLGWRVLVGLFQYIVDAFKWLGDAVDQLRYNIDEYLRFRTGDSRLSTVGKLIGGALWFFVSYVIVFVFTLLVEPQINPIKHFPVVTVSHKVILPLGPVFVEELSPFIGAAKANTIVWSTIWVIPGMFGFLVWELKENWKLYRANRPKHLKPVIVGHHGESMLGLLRPGFHSGTVPKLYGKLRKIERKRIWRDVSKTERKCWLGLHHTEESIARFVDRDLLHLIEQSRAWGGVDMHVGHVHLGGNCVHIELTCPTLSDEPAHLILEEQSGWLVASIAEAGWLHKVSVQQLDAFKACLSGFYKLAAVDMVREQIEAVIDVDDHPYDVDERGIVVWPVSADQPAAVYPLKRDASVDGQKLFAPAEGAASATPLKDDASIQSGESLRIFRHRALTWQRWVDVWKEDRDGISQPGQLVDGPPLVALERSRKPKV